MPADGAHNGFHLRSGRLAVCMLYVVMGFTIGSWGSRVPAIREQVGASIQAWGLINGIAAAGDILGLGIVLVLVGRVRTRLVAIIGAAGVVVAGPFSGFASSGTGIISGLLIWYLSAQVLATPMGALAVEVQTAYGRPLLSSFNAAFSVAVLIGAAVGTVAAALHVTPGVHFTVANTVLGVLLLVSVRWLPNETEHTTGPGAPRRRIRDRFTPQMRLVAVLAFLTGLIVSVSTQWSSLYIADELGAGNTVGGICFVLMSAAGVLTLLAGDRLTARHGGRQVLRAGALLASGGLVLALVVDQPAVAMGGLTLFAAGIACNNAIIDQFAASQPNLTPSEGISVSEMGQLPGFLLAPALIGTVAGAVGLRFALVVPVIAMVITGVLVGHLRRYREAAPAPGGGLSRSQ